MPGDRKEVVLRTGQECHDARINPFAAKLLFEDAAKLAPGRYVVDGGRTRIVIEVDEEEPHGS